ncbi:MAG: hypothetical protein M3114_08245 [Thermoproteota archaeon]|nr:hypothetical protein [Thermoproteota archaeon]MDQ4067561.1 hypothetical protein [Thermoproteota archaeon]
MSLSSSRLGLSRTKVSGAVAAAVIAASIGLIAIGVLSYIRADEPFKTWLVVYTPASQFGGIFLYSKAIWAATWIGMFFALRHKQNTGTLKTWLIVFLISLTIGTILVLASLDWSLLPTVLEQGSGNDS